MFELKVNLEVTLHTGAKIALTEEQTKRIKNYAIEVVLGAPDVLPEAPKKKTPKFRNKKNSPWSPSEDVFINEIVDRYAHIKKGLQNRGRASDLKRLRKEGLRHRSLASVYGRYNTLAARRRKMEMAQISEWTPVALRTK